MLTPKRKMHIVFIRRDKARMGVTTPSDCLERLISEGVAFSPTKNSLLSKPRLGECDGGHVFSSLCDWLSAGVANRRFRKRVHAYLIATLFDLDDCRARKGVSDLQV